MRLNLLPDISLVRNGGVIDIVNKNGIAYSCKNGYFADSNTTTAQNEFKARAIYRF